MVTCEGFVLYLKTLWTNTAHNLFPVCLVPDLFKHCTQSVLAHLPFPPTLTLEYLPPSAHCFLRTFVPCVLSNTAFHSSSCCLFGFFLFLWVCYTLHRGRIASLVRLACPRSVLFSWLHPLEFSRSYAFHLSVEVFITKTMTVRLSLSRAIVGTPFAVLALWFAY